MSLEGRRGVTPSSELKLIGSILHILNQSSDVMLAADFFVVCSSSSRLPLTFPGQHSVHFHPKNEGEYDTTRTRKTHLAPHYVYMAVKQ